MDNIKRALILGTGGLRGVYFTGVHAALRHKLEKDKSVIK